MNNYNIILLVIGISLLGVAYLPTFLEKKPLSYPIFYIGLGVVLFKLPLNLENPDPLRNKELATHLTELCVIIALMGTGLKIDRKLSWKSWIIPFKLIFITMVVSVTLLTLLGCSLNNLTLAAALLLASSLAPTDPVLASDVQVGPPGKGKEDTVRFSLTSEAGLNDGMAFPLVNLAIVLLSISTGVVESISFWLLKDVLYKVIIGVFIGWITGKLLGYLIFTIPAKRSFPRPFEGFIAVALTLLTYGATELFSGYGFLAVFVAAIIFRDSERDHAYHQELHAFSDQIEKLFILILLILFGGAIANGLLDELDLEGVAFGLIAIFIIRPFAAYLALYKTKSTRKEKLIISFFGIKGIGSFFYLSYATYLEKFPSQEKLWSIMGFTVLLSVIIHGVTASYAMEILEKELKEKEER